MTNRLVLLSLDDRFWLSLAALAGLSVYAVYLATHPYPAYGAGLYFTIAETISQHSYRLPASIPGYTEQGVPFAYPPLGFYVAAVVSDLTGLGPLEYSRLVPGLFMTASLVPYYFTAKELLGSPRKAGVSTMLLAGTPAVLQWHISAGGMIRGLGFLLAITGVYVGVRLFRTGSWKWLVPGAVLFGLTVLTHPTYTVFFGLSYLLLYAFYSRSIAGLVHGAAVAGGGILLASPWWIHIASVHGPDIFTAAAGTHGGLTGGFERVLVEFVYPVNLDAQAPFFLAAYAGTGYALLRGRYFLPSWLFAGGFVLGKPRFLFVAGSMLIAVVVFEVAVPNVRARALASQLGRNRRRVAELGVVTLVLLAAGGAGTAFAAGALDTHNGDPSQPAFIDEHDAEAMAWVASNTDRSATFVVLGDAAEWFPLLTDRTILVGPWGVEWTSAERYESELGQYKRISACDRAHCVTGELATSDLKPAYVYVPKDHYTVRGMSAQQDDEMRRSMVTDERYNLVFENEGVMIFAVDEQPTGVVVGPEQLFDREPPSDGADTRPA